MITQVVFLLMTGRIGVVSALAGIRLSVVRSVLVLSNANYNLIEKTLSPVTVESAESLCTAKIKKIVPLKTMN